MPKASSGNEGWSNDYSGKPSQLIPCGPFHRILAPCITQKDAHCSITLITRCLSATTSIPACTLTREQQPPDATPHAPRHDRANHARCASASSTFAVANSFSRSARDARGSKYRTLFRPFPPENELRRVPVTSAMLSPLEEEMVVSVLSSWEPERKGIPGSTQHSAILPHSTRAAGHSSHQDSTNQAQNSQSSEKPRSEYAKGKGNTTRAGPQRKQQISNKTHDDVGVPGWDLSYSCGVRPCEHASTPPFP